MYSLSTTMDGFYQTKLDTCVSPWTWNFSTTEFGRMSFLKKNFFLRHPQSDRLPDNDPSSVQFNVHTFKARTRDHALSVFSLSTFWAHSGYQVSPLPDDRVVRGTVKDNSTEILFQPFLQADIVSTFVTGQECPFFDVKEWTSGGCDMRYILWSSFALY